MCEHFSHARVGVSHDVWQLVPTLPDYLTCYGWSLRSVTLHRWFARLAQISVPACVPVQDLGRDVHLFTDGSCLNPGFPNCRVASWAVVMAGFLHMADASVVASGPLPGVLQSSYRAEIFAVWQALLAARMQTGRIFIWSDCSAVVRRLGRLLAGGEPKPNSAHSDLWGCMYDTIGDFQPGQIVLRKVVAHQNTLHAISPLDEWCIAQNSFADAAAACAQWQRPAEFWTWYAHHVNSVCACRDISRQVQQVLLAVSRAAVSDDGLCDENAREDLGVSPVVPPGTWQELGVLHIPLQAVRWYGDMVVRTVLSWYWQSVSSTAEVQWISQYQLYIDFMLCGECGPVKLDSWRSGDSVPHVDLLSISFLTRARWFSRTLKECLKHHGQGFQFSYCRPSSRALNLHTGCLAVPWRPSTYPLGVVCLDLWR